MAVAHDGEANLSSEITEVTSKTLTGKTTAGSNRVAIVAIGISTAATITTPTYGGSNCTQMTTLDFEGHRARLWYFVNPPLGSTNIVIGFSSTDDYGFCGCSSYNNVDQTTVFHNASTASSNASPITVDVSSVAGELVVDATAAGDGALTVGGGQTEVFNGASSGLGVFHGAHSYEAGAATVTMSWVVVSPSSCAICACSLIEAVGTSTPAVDWRLNPRYRSHRPWPFKPGLPR